MIDDERRNSYHLMEIRVAQIAARYILCKDWLKKKEDKVSSGENDPEAHYSTYVARVEESYNALEDNYKFIINNDFFYQNAYPFWWEDYFAKSTYYRTKKAAMRKFLRNFKDA